MPPSLLLSSTLPTLPHPSMPYQPPCCSIPSHLSCIKCKIATHWPHICHETRSLPQWCSGCCPILSWINTGAICRLADTKMFVFQGNPPPSLYSSWPLPFQTQRGENDESFKLNMWASNWTRHCDVQHWSSWDRPSGFFFCVRAKVEEDEKPETLEDIISMGADEIGWDRWFWMINPCDNKSDLQTEMQIKTKSKYWYSS